MEHAYMEFVLTQGVNEIARNSERKFPLINSGSYVEMEIFE